MSAYYKLIGTLVGSIVGIVLTYAATKGFGTCTATGCTVFGISDVQITATLMLVLSAVGVHQAPPNNPESS